MISVLLCEEYLSEDVLDVLFLIEKCILGSEISAQEYYRIQCFMKDTNREHSTLHDLVIEQLKSVIRWAFDFDSEALLYNPKSILYIILSCYREFESRIVIASKTGKKCNAYDIVKAYTETTIGKFSKQDALISCPSLGSSSVESALKKLVEEGVIIELVQDVKQCI